MLNLITENNEGNRLTEAKFSKLYQEPSPEVEDLDKESICRVADNGNLVPNDINYRDRGLD